MAVLKVRKYGDPTLRKSAAPVGDVTPELRKIIADMTETMYDEVGIGLAAPQVGISLRLIVISDEDNRGVQALLNPAIVERGGEVQDLSEEEVLARLYSPSREERRAAARGLSLGLRQNSRLLGFVFNTLVQDKAVDDRLRAYPAPIAARTAIS